MSPGWPGSRQAPCVPLASLPLLPATRRLTTWAQAAPDPQVWGGHSMWAPHRATPCQGHLAAALVSVYGNSREDIESLGPSQGGYEVPGPGREGVDSQEVLDVPGTARAQPLPLDHHQGELPVLSDFLICCPTSLPTSPWPWWGQRRPTCSVTNFPVVIIFLLALNNTHSFIQLIFLSPWAELGFGAAKMTQLGSSRGTQSLVE